MLLHNQLFFTAQREEWCELSSRSWRCWLLSIIQLTEDRAALLWIQQERSLVFATCAPLTPAPPFSPDLTRTSFKCNKETAISDPSVSSRCLQPEPEGCSDRSMSENWTLSHLCRRVSLYESCCVFLWSVNELICSLRNRLLKFELSFPAVESFK